MGEKFAGVVEHGERFDGHEGLGLFFGERAEGGCLGGGYYLLGSGVVGEDTVDARGWDALWNGGCGFSQ